MDLSKAPLMAVIVPMFNEELGAAKCIQAICSKLARDLPSGHLIVVNDGSIDQTGKILEDLKDKYTFDVVTHAQNRGYGAAIATGALDAHKKGFEFGLMMDSDLTNDPGLIKEFYRVVSSGQFDLVKASRYIEGGGVDGVPWFRRLPSILGNYFASICFGLGIRDCTNGFRAIRLDLVAHENFRERGFAAIMEELVILKGKKVRATEIPYILTSRSSDLADSKFSYSWKTVRKYLFYSLQALVLK
jgi:dolichol-phosphate mannosyltransferase